MSAGGVSLGGGTSPKADSRACARDPAEADWWVEQERRTGRQFLKNTSFRELRDSALVPIERLTGRELAIASNTDDARPCACTD